MVIVYDVVEWNLRRVWFRIVFKGMIMKYQDIEDFCQRCENHPDHQTGMINNGMLIDRLHEEISELRTYIEAELAKPEQELDYPPECTMPELEAAYAAGWWKALEVQRNKQQALDKKADNARVLGLDYEPEQEPVAYLYHDAPCAELANPIAHSTLLVLACNRKPNYRNETPLYTAPTKREWQGLTDEEIRLMAHNDDDNDWDDLHHKYVWHKGYLEGARAVETKLREKNT